MEFKHKVMRATVASAIDSAIADLKNNTSRSIRKLIDMGDSLSHGPNMKSFYHAAREVISNSQNPYYTLIRNMVTNVDPQIISALGTNIGYSAFTYGVEQIRRSEAEIGRHVPWMIVFGRDARPEAAALLSFVGEAVRLGTYTFCFDASDGEAIGRALKVAAHYPECTVYLSLAPHLITDGLAQSVKNLKSVIPCVSSDGYDAAFETLKRHGLLYGFTAEFTAERKDYYMSREFTSLMVENGCLFGTFTAKAHSGLDETLFEFVCGARGKDGRPLLMFAWPGDSEYISNVVSPGNSYALVGPEGNISIGNRSSACGAFSRPFRETVAQFMPKLFGTATV